MSAVNGLEFLSFKKRVTVSSAVKSDSGKMMKRRRNAVVISHCPTASVSRF